MSTVPVSNKADALKAMVEGEKAKVDLVKASWLDQPLVEELRMLIKARAKVKRKEDELDSHKRDLISQIEVLMETLGLDSALEPGAGSMTKYTQDRSNLDRSKLKEELLKSGMPAEVIIRCFNKATTYTTASGVKFTPA